ncbi:MAG: hypothetical protein KAI66_03185 [Lentisphaeria bacterium]|nr:hypothetical protein [Lentisphaeria bacterium]
MRTLLCSVCLLVLLAGCGKSKPVVDDDGAPGARGEIVYVDNASDRVLQVRIDGHDVGDVPAGTWLRLRLRHGKHHFVATAGSETVADVTAELPKAQIGIFNPGGDARYSVGGHREGARAYQSGHTLFIETGPDQNWAGKLIEAAEWLTVTADRSLEQDMMGEVPDETTKLYKRVPPTLTVSAARHMLTGPRGAWLAVELAKAAPILAEDGTLPSSKALLEGLRGRYIESLDATAAAALAKADRTALTEDLAAALVEAMTGERVPLPRITRLGELLDPCLTPAHVEAVAAAAPSPGAWSALLKGLTEPGTATCLALARHGIASNDREAAYSAVALLNRTDIATDLDTVRQVDEWLAALPAGKTAVSADFGWNTIVVKRMAELKTLSAPQLDRQARCVLPPHTAHYVEGPNACIATDNYALMTTRFDELSEVVRERLIGEQRHVRSRRKFTMAYKAFLLRALRDSVPKHRGNAAEILRSQYSKDADILPPLIAMLTGETDEDVRSRARLHVGILTIEHAETLDDPVTALLGVATHPPSRLHGKALRKIAALPVPDEQILDEVARALERAPNAEVKRRLVSFLDGRRFAGERRCRLVLPLLSDGDGELRQLVFVRLATWIAKDVPDSAPYLAAFTRAVTAESGPPRRTIMQNLLDLAMIDAMLDAASSREEKTALAPKLAHYLKADSENARNRVVSWLVESDHPDVLAALVEHFDRIPARNYGSMLSKLGAAAVAKNGKKAQDPRVAVLRRGTRHPKGWVRRAACNALLGVILRDTSAAGDALLAELRQTIEREPDENIRKYLAEHLSERLKFRR